MQSSKGEKAMSESKGSGFNRRDFVGAVTAVGAGILLTRCGKTYPKITFVDKAPDGPMLKAGLVGCGGRGTGAAQDFLKAGPNLQITALADVFADRVQDTRKTLQEKANQKITDDQCFVGFDAYKKLIASGVDIVILATPPHFRPEHLDAAVDAKKHVFMEKPVAVDPVGARSVMASGEKAKSFNLSIVAGTQRRHQREYIETQSRVANGAIGKITSVRVYWNQSQLWYRERQKGWSDMEAMIRDWVNWGWLSGDHIVEQHVHNLDVAQWFLGTTPAKAVGMGYRVRRVTGDQYDFFCIDFAVNDEVHIQSTCRQVDGCINNVSEYVVGTEGSTNCKDTIFDKEGKIVWQYQEPGKEPGKSAFNPYEQEHVDLVTAIRTNQPINEASNVAKSTLMAIMGRISAYTGQLVTWDQMMQSNLRLGPKEYALGPVDIKAEVPVPGSAKKSKADEE
jgi:myo-inositol 2-dehydrogenase/D-chiro-inositol 1-dehydrogenase